MQTDKNLCETCKVRVCGLRETSRVFPICDCGYYSTKPKEHGVNAVINYTDDLSCPFCHEVGFDEVGLKHHLENDCDKYKDVLSVEEEKRLEQIKKDK